MNKNKHPLSAPHTANHWAWIPSLYFAQGLPYIVVMSVAVVLFNRLGISNTAIAFYTSWLYLPWVIKPLWSPLIDILKNKRWWIVSMQMVIGAGLACIALTLDSPSVFQYSLAFMWLLAFSSATHDIAADGFYMLALDEKKQAYFVGIRNTFYRLAVIFGQGILVMIAGILEQLYGRHLPADKAISGAWSVTFYLLAGIFIALFIYHYFILPHPAGDQTARTGKNKTKAFLEIFLAFFHKPYVLQALLFILLYRFAESQLVKIATPFLLDPLEKGGLQLETAEVGFIYGTIGVAALTVGGILGGIALAKKGLHYWLWWMTLAMNVPNIVYLFLSFIHPTNLFFISACVTLEQFGYGFGFTSLTFFMMLFSRGNYQTAHYALCTGFMALGMMLPGMISGVIADAIGYQWFFLWVMICTIPSFLATSAVSRIKFNDGQKYLSPQK